MKKEKYHDPAYIANTFMAWALKTRVERWLEAKQADKKLTFEDFEKRDKIFIARVDKRING